MFFQQISLQDLELVVSAWISISFQSSSDIPRPDSPISVWYRQQHSFWSFRSSGFIANLKLLNILQYILCEPTWRGLYLAFPQRSWILIYFDMSGGCRGSDKSLKFSVQNKTTENNLTFKSFCIWCRYLCHSHFSKFQCGFSLRFSLSINLWVKSFLSKPEMKVNWQGSG